MNINLESQQIKIRNLRRSDIKDVYKYMTDSKSMEFINGIYDMKTIKKIVNKNIRMPKIYAIQYKPTNKVIGHIIYHPDEEDEIYEFGIIMSSNFWGQGLATESYKLIENYSFNNLKLNKLIAYTISLNGNSINFLDANNFILEGRLKNHNLHNNVWCDELIFSKFNEKYIL